MNDQTDSQLLRAYVEKRTEPAFAELVRRHVDFVYSSAQRMVCDSHLAEDVTQGVFVALAKQAVQLADRPVLSGWLHCTAQNIAAQTVRTDVRRRAREQEAVAMNELIAGEPEARWEQIAPHLDAALGELGESDRDALLLRYFERKSAQEMAQTLGISDEAAQKRVSRAVERLREFFSKRKITIGTSGLAVIISANAVQAAPIGLALTISTAAVLTGTVVSTSTAIAVTKTIAMTTLQKTLVTATVAILAGAGIYEAHQAAQLREQNQTLQQQQVPLAKQIQQLQRERDDATNQLAELLAKGGQLKSNQNTIELLKLRGEVTRLKTMESDPTEMAAKAWLAKVNKLKQQFETIPDAKIPELQFLSDLDWLELANTTIETDSDYRKAMGEIRKRGEGYFVKELQSALKSYMENNNGQWPTDISQLKNNFAVPVDDAMLQRWEIVSKTALPNQNFAGDWVITEKTPADSEFDHRWTIDGPFSAGVGPYHYQPPK